MGMGCGVVILLFLIMVALSPILMLFDGGYDVGGYNFLFSGLAIWALYSIFKSDGKDSKSNTSTGYQSSAYRPPRSSSSSSSSSGSSSSSDEDDLLDAAIAAGLTYSVFCGDSDGDDFDDDNDNDIDDWDGLYCEYKDDDIFDDDWDDW